MEGAGHEDPLLRRTVVEPLGLLSDWMGLLEVIDSTDTVAESQGLGLETWNQIQLSKWENSVEAL